MHFPLHGRSRESRLWRSLSVRAINETSLISTNLFRHMLSSPNDAIGTRAYRLIKSYGKSHGLHVFDSLVAATGLEEGITVVTKNRKHFAMIEGLSLDVPTY